MDIFLPIFLHEVAAVIITAGGCWLALKRNHRPSWHLGILGAVTVAAFEVLFPDGGFVFHPDRFKHSKTSPAIEFQGFLLMVGIALIPALLTVGRYRKKFRENPKPLA